MRGDDAPIPGRVLQQTSEGLPQALEPGGAQLRGGAQRRQSREEEGLGAQDVAHAGDALLVQQRDRERCPAALQGLEGARGGGLRAQRILPQPGAGARPRPGG